MEAFYSLADAEAHSEGKGNHCLGMKRPTEAVGLLEVLNLEEEEGGEGSEASVEIEVEIVVPVLARPPRSILKQPGTASPMKKSVRWSDSRPGGKLTKVGFVSLSGVDRTSTNSEWQRRRQQKRRSQDFLMCVCCGALITLVVLFVAVLFLIILMLE
jgi:hypothetical protein